MRTGMILCMMCLVLFTTAYPEVLNNFPDMARPTWLRINDGYVYISDQYSILVYDMKTFKLVKKLARKGEGPEEFKYFPRVFFTSDKLILCDGGKIITYSRDFKLIKEIKLRNPAYQIIPVGDNFVLGRSKDIDGRENSVFTLYDSKIEKIKDILIEPRDPDYMDFFITPTTKCRSWNDKIFIARPKKGFYIDVFDKNGETLYQIEKDVERVKSEEKHREAALEEVLHFVGRSRFERARKRGAFKRPMKEFLPAVKNFWLLDDRIYVKTHDITDTKEKYIIMDLEGNILKTVFLPRAYRRILTFSKNKFYYLSDSGEDGWALHEVDLQQ